MYQYFEAFRKDALACGGVYYPDVSLKPQNIDAAFKIYQTAKKGTTLLDADGKGIIPEANLLDDVVIHAPGFHFQAVT